MDYNHIKFKKPHYRVKAPLREYLKTHNRLASLPLSYNDLLRYSQLIPKENENGEPTLWYSVLYDSAEMEDIFQKLVEIYEFLVGDGSEVPHLRIGSVDFCEYGNSQPFRIKVVNAINDNHDYYYLKKADASRVYGLELEDVFSPDKVLFYVDQDTLLEQHIVGIPGDDFTHKHPLLDIENRTRLAKEFVKFNERCFSRLLGDMRAYNFVIEIIQDFDNIQYKIRAMDFDQQCYEGRKNFYLPQFFKDNLAYVNLAQKQLNLKTSEQYQREERSAMRNRFLTAKSRTRSLLRRIKHDQISTPEKVEELKRELAKHHRDNKFLSCANMGEILTLNLERQIGVAIF